MTLPSCDKTSQIKIRVILDSLLESLIVCEFFQKVSGSENIKIIFSLLENKLNKIEGVIIKQITTYLINK